MYSPTAALGKWPTTVTRARRPVGWTRSTAKPLSGLWKVMRSMMPERVSTMIAILPGNGGITDVGCEDRVALLPDSGGTTLQGIAASLGPGHRGAPGLLAPVGFSRRLGLELAGWAASTAP